MQASTAANNSDTRAQLRRRRVRLRQHDRPLDGAWRLGMVTVVTRQPPISFAPSPVPFLFPWPHRTAGISAAELTARPPGLFRAKSALSFHRPTPRVQHKAALVGSWRAFYWRGDGVMAGFPFLDQARRGLHAIRLVGWGHDVQTHTDYWYARTVAHSPALAHGAVRSDSRFSSAAPIHQALARSIGHTWACISARMGIRNVSSPHRARTESTC